MQHGRIRRGISRRFDSLARRSREPFVEMQLDQFVAGTRKQRVRQLRLRIISE